LEIHGRRQTSWLLQAWITRDESRTSEKQHTSKVVRAGLEPAMKAAHYPVGVKQSQDLRPQFLSVRIILMAAMMPVPGLYFVCSLLVCSDNVFENNLMQQHI